jgi:hypothetical protein
MNVMKARSDIASILAWTEENFGSQTLKRYARLADDTSRGTRQKPFVARDRGVGQRGVYHAGSECE